MKRIGILGGLSAESTALFYNTLTRLYIDFTIGNFTKVMQRVPVTISLNNFPAGAVPGMNVTVKIHR